MFSNLLHRVGYGSTTKKVPYLPKHWQTPEQQQHLELAVITPDRLAFLKKSFDATFFTPQRNHQLTAMADKDAVDAYFLGIHNYLLSHVEARRVLFRGTLLEDMKDTLTHTVLMSLLGYQNTIPATLVRSGVNPQSLDAALAYKLSSRSGYFFRREGQQLNLSDKTQPYIHIPNEEVVQRLKQLQADRYQPRA